MVRLAASISNKYFYFRVVQSVCNKRTVGKVHKYGAFYLVFVACKAQNKVLREEQTQRKRIQTHTFIKQMCPAQPISIFDKRILLVKGNEIYLDAAKPLNLAQCRKLLAKTEMMRLNMKIMRRNQLAGSNLPPGGSWKMDTSRGP